jgi:peroxiredoxin
MAQLEPYQEKIGASGSLVYIAAEKREGLFKPAEFLSKQPISFPFLLDEERQVTKTYGLYHRLGTDAFHIAHPATLVVDRRGIIRFIYRGEDQRDRAPIEQVLTELQRAST